MGLFAKGKYGKFARMSYNKPLATNLVPVNVTNASTAIAVDNNSGNTKYGRLF
jgi:hypothetical protein